MSIPRPKKNDIVLMWKGAISGSPYPVPANEKNDPERWVEARVVDVPTFRAPKKQSYYLCPVEGGHSPKWVPAAGWKELP